VQVNYGFISRIPLSINPLKMEILGECALTGSAMYVGTNSIR
jgi:hypothetical protein